ncbi:cobalt/nickel transport system ATP-binding protein [Methanococcus voltae]|uniref:ATP-binding cassette domain-containing protein n=1 Tax=Methanococcus voltae TaxID=2188 RepID=UPI001AE793B1|nr:ATP-binding cassette domain-containing protein [Methanococcus voltae]MBP2143737.1 cobalt/nickel transport system ATP-binding protein [Methanococcus voltae]
MPILEVNDLIYKYPDGTSALKGINFKAEEGDMIAILGPNGAGKSTLFLHFNGILKPKEGVVKVKEKPISYKNKDLLEVRKTVGIVFQNPDDQLFAPTVAQDVAFGPMNLGLDKEEVTKRVKEALKAVDMEGYDEKPPHHLSGGQKKRVAIAGILAMKPEIIVLDEPTAGLDPLGASQIMRLLYELNKQGITIIISTHDVDLVPVYANKVYLISDGKIIKNGTPKEIFNDTEAIRNSKLRLPRISHLLEILKREDKLNIDMSYTIGEARVNLLEYMNKSEIKG